MHTHSLFETVDYHPIVITPREDRSVEALREYLAHEHKSLQWLLIQHGGLLFRGFNIRDARDFRACVESAGAHAFGYVGGDSPRSRVLQDVYTSTDYPASEAISLHNEMSYLQKWPRRLFFFCLTAARIGGQTPLAHGRDVLRQMPPDVVQRFKEKGVNYISTYNAGIKIGKSWQETYGTNDRAEVEATILSQGSTCNWSSSNGLQVRTKCDAVVLHPQTKEEVWFNQAEQWHPSALGAAERSMLEELLGKGRLPHDCEYGDGEAIEEETLAGIRRVLADRKMLFDWEQGDLLMIDNVLMMHGREAYQGDRKILAYLSSN